MCDPDAPSRQNATRREFLHWLVVNIPGKNVKQGELKMDYRGPSPPLKSGILTIFIVFRLFFRRHWINYT